MTTAARPTFDPAKGGSGVREKSLGKLSTAVSSRDLPAHLKLKERLPGQDTVDELKERDFRAELEERELISQIEKEREDKCRFVPSLEQAAQVRLAIKAERDRERAAAKDSLLDNNSVITDTKVENASDFKIVNARKMAQLDADEDFGSVDLSESDFEDDDDEENDTAELMAELNKIKQERQAERERQEQEQRLREESVRSTTTSEASFSIKRRWDDDVPFKNCAREDPNPKRKLYINDTLRQEFHKRFMDKYIR